jgi:hypothetical protein
MGSNIYADTDKYVTGTNYKKRLITANKRKRADSVIVRAQDSGPFGKFCLRLTNKVSIFK